MEEQTDYESAYEGEQMDEAFGRILGMRVGRVQIKASADDAAAVIEYIGEGYGGHAFFSNARCTSISGNVGVIASSVGYDTDSGNAVFRIDGEGVRDGETYEVEFLAIEISSDMEGN